MSAPGRTKEPSRWLSGWHAGKEYLYTVQDFDRRLPEKARAWMTWQSLPELVDLCRVYGVEPVGELRGSEGLSHVDGRWHCYLILASDAG